MADSKIKRTLHGVTETTTRRDSTPLTHEEERIVRMRHGLSESDDAVLEFVESPDAEVNARLKLMEAALLAEIHGEGPLAETAEPASPKKRILDHLVSLERD